jgi:hypothetical protein
MNDMEKESHLNSLYVENNKIAIDSESENISKKNQASKFMHFDDDLMEAEVVQLKSSLSNIPDEDDSTYV